MRSRTSSSDEAAAQEAQLKSQIANHLQFAALPWRHTNTLEILLITSRRSKRWIVPKGWPIEGLSPHASAAQEALEEGGIVGKVSSTILGTYHYFKQLKNGISIPCKVVVFPLEVTRMRRNWPEKPDRTLRWCSPHDAANAVTESDLKLLIRRFARHHHGADASVVEK